MKTLLLSLTVLMVLASCGKSNKVSSSVSGSNAEVTALRPAALVDFSGNYDQVGRNDSRDCGGAVVIAPMPECSGYKLMSNNRNNGVEEFCNINKGQFRPRNDGNDSNPPNPDRNPPNPDRNPPKTDVAVVTLEGNQLKSVLTIAPNVAYTNTLTLGNDGILTKVSNFKSRDSRCTYLKR